MSIEKAAFDAMSEDDLQELVTAQVPEGLRIEYKRESYGGSDGEKREYLKDISALANSQGGHLIIGMEEAGGVAKRVVGIGAVDPDSELLRLEQIARSALEPPIVGLRMKAIPLAAGGAALLIRVPRSWALPHRVVANGVNRFFVRHSAGVHEPSVGQLRALFTQSTSALDQARQFRSQRIATIQSGVGQRPLEGGGRLILHIFPVASFSGAHFVAMDQVYAEYARFVPLGQPMGMTPGFNYDGFVNHRGGDLNYGYTQVFRDGRLEATKASLRSGNPRFVSALSVEQSIFTVLSRYVDGLQNIGVPPPLIFMLSLEGVLGASCIVGRHEWDDDEYPAFPDDVVMPPECVLEDYGSLADLHKAVRPIFDALWNSAGRARAAWFNDDGLWVGAR